MIWLCTPFHGETELLKGSARAQSDPDSGYRVRSMFLARTGKTAQREIASDWIEAYKNLLALRLQ
jgi:hypothetical protein